MKKSEQYKEQLIEEAYLQSNNDNNRSIKVAFLYRRKLHIDILQDEITKKIQKSLGPFSKGDSIFDAITTTIVDFLGNNGKQYNETELMLKLTQELNKFDSSSIPYSPDILTLCSMVKATVNDKTFPETINKEIIESIFIAQRSKYKANLIVSIPFTIYFKKPFHELEDGGMVYLLPAGIHKWSYNASWLLGHFHKGTEFIIYSDITNDAKYDRRKEFGPGFFREVAICYSLGYRCKRKENNQIILKHPNPDLLKEVKLEEILRISETEVSLKGLEHHYDLAVADYTLLRTQQRGLNPNAEPYKPKSPKRLV